LEIPEQIDPKALRAVVNLRSEALIGLLGLAWRGSDLKEKWQSPFFLYEHIISVS